MTYDFQTNYYYLTSSIRIERSRTTSIRNRRMARKLTSLKSPPLGEDGNYNNILSYILMKISGKIVIRNLILWNTLNIWFWILLIQKDGIWSMAVLWINKPLKELWNNTACCLYPDLCPCYTYASMNSGRFVGQSNCIIFAIAHILASR